MRLDFRKLLSRMAQKRPIETSSGVKGCSSAAMQKLRQGRWVTHHRQGLQHSRHDVLYGAEAGEAPVAATVLGCVQVYVMLQQGADVHLCAGVSQHILTLRLPNDAAQAQAMLVQILGQVAHPHPAQVSLCTSKARLASSSSKAVHLRLAVLTLP